MLIKFSRIHRNRNFAMFSTHALLRVTQEKDLLRGAQETQGRRLEKIIISSHSEGLSNFHDYQTSIDTSIALYSVFHINEFLMDHTENHISVQLFHAMLIDIIKNKETNGILADPI